MAQRVYGLALGYEDLNDHQELRRDPLLAVLAEKPDPTGESRVRARDQGQALAGKSTLNRLELTAAEVKEKERYKKIGLDFAAVDQLLGEIFVQAHGEPPQQIILDLDSTDDPLHGNQEGRFFHGYYGHYCYLPLYIFCGEHLLCARLRPANIDGAAESVEEVARLVKQLRQAWPEVRIIVRGDSGFCREELMAWCEANQVDYVMGLAKNDRLRVEIAAELAQAADQYQQSHQAARIFKELRYQTRESWSRARRVVAKAEHLEKGANPRFVVTSLPSSEWAAQALYEESVLRTRRNGKSHQRTIDAVLRPHQHGLSAQQSNPLVLFFRGLLADAGVAETGTAGNRDGPGTVHDATAEAAENRSAHSDHSAESVGVDGRRLPLRGTVSTGLCAAAGSALAGLKKGGGRGPGLRRYPQEEVCPIPPVSPCGSGALSGVSHPLVSSRHGAAQNPHQPPPSWPRIDPPMTW